MKSLGIDEKTVTMISNIVDNLKIIFSNIWEAAKEVVSIVKDVAITLFGLDGADSSVNPIAKAFEIVTSALKTVTGWIRDFAKYVKENQVLMTALKVAVILFASNLAYLKVGGVITTLFNGFKLALTAVRIAWMVLSVAFSLSPFGVILTAIAAVVAGLTWFFTQTETGKNLWSSFVEQLKIYWVGLQVFFSDLWETIKTIISTAWTGIVTYFSTTWAAIKLMFESVWGGIKGFFVGIWESITTTITTVWNAIVTFFTTIWDAIKLTVETVWNGIVTFFVTIWKTIKTTVETVWNGIKEFFVTL